MAGERKGITYEAILYVVLERLRKKGKLKGKVFWNETPNGMTIEPDLIVGPDKDHPTAMLLVTHSGSAKESEKKFWRNMGELVEAKTQQASVPRVYNVAFDSVIKESLKKVQATAFDGQLIAGDEGYGAALQAWVDANNKSLPKDRFEKAEEVAQSSSGAKELRKLMSKLEADVVKLIRSTNPMMDSVWKAERKRPKGTAPKARETFVRRGLSKLLVFEDADLALRLYAREKVKSDEVPDYAFAYGLARKSIGGVVPADIEALQAVAMLGHKRVSPLLRCKHPAGLVAVVEQARAISNIRPMLTALTSHYSMLTTPKGLLLALESQHADPSHLLPKRVPYAPTDIWLFRVLMDVVKASTGQKQGYGYAQLVQDLKKHNKAGVLAPFVRKATGSRSWSLPASSEPVRRGLQDYINRLPGTSFSRELLAATAFVLASEFSAVSEKKLAGLESDLTETWRSSTFEARLLTHRSFDSLLLLIRQECPAMVVIREKACFAQAAQLGGLSGDIQVARINNTLINWQSASDAGRDHKKKELCGRAVGLRYSWDTKTKTFIKRPGLDKLILVVDGTWRQSDLDALVQSGWDEIFYPDEMDKLAAAIV